LFPWLIVKLTPETNTSLDQGVIFSFQSPSTLAIFKPVAPIFTATQAILQT
jgi:hypothetical protein